MVTKADGMRNEILMPDAVQGYLNKHKLDEIVVAALNSCAKVMPDDPFGHIAVLLAQNCCSAPSFMKLEYDPLEPGDLRFHVVVSIRGVHVRVRSLSFDDVLFRTLPSEAPPGEERSASKGSVGSADELRELDPLTEQVQAQQREAQMVTFLEGFFKTAFEHVSVDDLISFAERCAGLSEAPLPGPGFAVDLSRATRFLTNELVTAAAHCLSISGLELLQRTLASAGLAEFVSPPLKTPEDLAAWRTQSMWLRFAMPIFHGGGPSVCRVTALRFCAAFTPFACPPASPVPHLETPADCPALGWLLAVCQLGRDARAEAVKALQADKALGSLVVEGNAHCHPEGLLQTARLAQKAAEAVAGERAPSETSGVLLAYAIEAWVPEEDVYEFETGKKLTLEQLVDLYAEIAEEGWLRMIFQPFRPEDNSAGCELLKARAPNLRLVTDLTGPVLKSKLKGEAYSCPLRPSETVSAAITQYSELADLWREADGCGRCIFLDPLVASSMPPLIHFLLALRDAEVVMLPSEITDEDVAQMSSCVDDVLCHVLYAHEAVDA